MKRYGLNKRHKLCSVREIDNLFKGVGTSAAIAYPLRAIWRENPLRGEGDALVKILVSVPKKRLRHAVDRVAMRRRVREAYRLHRHEAAIETPVDIAFVYVANELRPYSHVESAMKRLLSSIHSKLSDNDGVEGDCKEAGE